MLANQNSEYDPDLKTLLIVCEFNCALFELALCFERTFGMLEEQVRRDKMWALANLKIHHAACRRVDAVTNIFYQSGQKESACKNYSIISMLTLSMELPIGATLTHREILVACHS